MFGYRKYCKIWTMHPFANFNNIHVTSAEKFAIFQRKTAQQARAQYTRVFGYIISGLREQQAIQFGVS